MSMSTTPVEALIERGLEAAGRVAKRCMGHETRALISIPVDKDNVDVIISDLVDALRIIAAERDERPDWKTVNATYEKWKARAEAAEAELERARAEARRVLEPFAEAADEFDYVKDGDGSFLWSQSSNIPSRPAKSISVNNVRAARNFIKEGGR